MTSISDTNVVNAPGGLVELGYSQITSPVNVTVASGSYNTIINDMTIVSDGSPLIVEFFSPYVSMAAGAPTYIVTALFVDGAVSGYLTESYSSANVGSTLEFPVYGSRRITLSAGVHTIGVRAFRGASNGQIGANTGTGTSYPPAFLRVSKIIQASQLLVQTPNAPLVTSLPSNAIDGQEVRYLADNTNGIIWNFRYRAGSSSSYKWEFIGGAPLYSAGSGGITTTSTSWVFWSTSPNITVPFAGDYLAEVAASCGQQTNAVNTAYCTIGVNGGSQSENNGVWSTSSGQWDGSTGMNVTKMTLAANDNLRFYVRGDYNTSTSAFDKGRLSVTPIRVSA